MSELTIEKITETYKRLEKKLKQMPAAFDAVKCHPANRHVFSDYPCRVVISDTTPESIIILTNNGWFVGLVDLETGMATVFTEYKFRQLLREYVKPLLPSSQGQPPPRTAG